MQQFVALEKLGKGAIIELAIAAIKAHLVHQLEKLETPIIA